MHDVQFAFERLGDRAACGEQCRIQARRLFVRMEGIDRRQDHGAMVGLRHFHEQYGAGCVTQQFPVGVSQHPSGHMACGVALGDDEVCLDAHRASHDRFGRGVVPLGSAGDFDVVFANALSEHLEALQRGSKSFCFEVL